MSDYIVGEPPDLGIPVQVTIAHAARLLDCSESTVRRLCREGELSSSGRRRLRRVEYASILAYSARHRRSPAAPGAEA